MGPKKAKGKQEVIVGQYNVEEMTESELQEYAMKLHEEIVRTREETEKVVKEKQSLECFWHVMKKELEKKKRKLVAIEAEAEELKIDFDKLLSSTNQKLDYLQKENLQKLLKQAVEANLNRLQYEGIYLEEEQVTANRVKQKVDETQKLEICYENLIQRTRQIRRDEISELIQYYEEKLSQTTWKYESLYSHLWDTINAKRLALFREAESSKNRQIQQIDEIRTRECQEMRDYFSRIAFDCLALIGELKTELESLKKSEKEQKKFLRDAVNENKNLHQLQKENDAAKLHLDEYSRSKKTFFKARKIMHEYMVKIKDLEFENHMLSQKVECVSKQINDLNVQFSEAVRKLQQSSSLKSVFLEKKFKALRSMLQTEGKKSEENEAKSVPLVSKARSQPPQPQKTPISRVTPYPISVINMQFMPDAQIHFVPPLNLEP